MPAVIAILGVLAAAAFWILRARNVAHAATELADVANDVRLAARRFGFRRRSGQHPVEGIDDEKVAIATLGIAILELDHLPAREQQIALGRGLQRELGVNLDGAEELMVLGRWLMNECGGAEPAVARVARRLYKIGGGAAFAPLMGVVKDIASAGDGISDRQKQALDALKRAFRIS